MYPFLIIALGETHRIRNTESNDMYIHFKAIEPNSPPENLVPIGRSNFEAFPYSCHLEHNLAIPSMVRLVGEPFSCMGVHA